MKTEVELYVHQIMEPVDDGKRYKVIYQKQNTRTYSPIGRLSIYYPKVTKCVNMRMAEAIEFIHRETGGLRPDQTIEYWIEEWRENA